MLAQRVGCLVVLGMLAQSASAQSYRYAVTPNFGSDNVSVVDVDSQTEVATIETRGRHPLAVAVTPDGTRAFVLHHSAPAGSQDISEIDLQTLSFAGKVPGLVPVGSDLEITPDGKWLLVASKLNAQLSRYDLANLTAGAATLDLAPNAISLEDVEVMITDDSRYAFVSVGASDEIVQVHLDTMQSVNSSLTGGLNSTNAVAMDVATVWGAPNNYLVSWVRNESSMLVYTWDVGAGAIATGQSNLPGMATDVKIDVANLQVGVAGEFVVGFNNVRGAIQTWDFDTASLMSMATSPGANAALSRLLFDSGTYYATKVGSGVQEFQIGAGGVVADFVATSPANWHSDVTTTRAQDVLVFTLPNATGPHELVIVDKIARQVVAEVTISGLEPTEVVIAECAVSLTLNRCNGDGGNGAGCGSCPCGNEMAPNSTGGCLNSTGTATRLRGSGVPSVSLLPGSSEDLRFSLTGAPPHAHCVLASGETLEPDDASHPCFGEGSGVFSSTLDGLRCVSTTLRRHGGRRADSFGDVGFTSNPWGGEGPPHHGIAAAGFSAGQTRFFQVTHREDPLAMCLTGLNTSQALQVTFCP